MNRMIPGLWRRLARFAGGERGTVSVEFVMWVPLLMTFLLVAVDTSTVFMRQANFWQVSRDTARLVSRYAMTEAEAASYAAAEAGFGEVRPQVDVTVDGGLVTVTISSDMAATAPFGILNFALGDQLRARITHAMEPS